jgi:pre-mRNA-processing factor 17
VALRAASRLTLQTPAEKWLACQSLDNTIVVYAADSFRQNRKKVFAGHQIAGYACQVNFSPDGRYISSGDGDGNVVFWDWKSGRLLKRLRAHKEVVISHEWLPHESVSAGSAALLWLLSDADHIAPCSPSS